MFANPIHLLVTCNPAGNDARDHQEQTHTEQVFGVTPRDAAIINARYRDDLEDVDEVALTPGRLWKANSGDHQKSQYEH